MLSAERLEAVLYDWHNEHLLRRQRQDQSFYADLLADRTSILVLGAGTGRVSTAIADSCAGTVLALDRSLERLQRAPHRSNMFPIPADMRHLPVTDAIADVVLYPYSTFQMLESKADRLAALGEARRAMREDAVLLVDISTRFEDRPPGSNTRMVLQAHCHELDQFVTEMEVSELRDDHLAIRRIFQVGGESIVEFVEHWHFAGSLRMPELLSKTRLKIVDVLHGYSTDTTHRHIYRVTPI